MNTVLVRYGHSRRTKQYTINPNAKYAVKAEISMKTISFNNSAKRSAFPPASGRMTPINVCLWRHREYGDSNKRCRQRRFEPSQETGVKKMINGNVSSEFISLWFASVYGAASSIQLRLASAFTLTKSTRTVTLQDVQPHNVTSGRPFVTAEVTILVREYPENYQK